MYINCDIWYTVWVGRRVWTVICTHKRRPAHTKIIPEKKIKIKNKIQKYDSLIKSHIGHSCISSRH